MNYDNIPLLRVLGLSLTRPWPWAFVNGRVPKRAENRSWACPRYVIERGVYVALHSAQSWSEDDREFISEITELPVPSKKEHPQSQIFAVCRVAKCYDYLSDRDYVSAGEQERWCFGPYVWVLTSFIPLVSPVSCKGAHGLWGFGKKQFELAALRDSYLRSKDAVSAT